jgi:hypothetical protein
MKPNPKTAAQKAALKRAGPFDAASLSRSYGVDFPEVVRILKSRGKHHG